MGLSNTSICSLSIFTLTCFLCGICPDVITLSMMRLVQVAAAGILYSLGLLVIKTLIPEEEQGRWYGLIVAAPSAALGLSLLWLFSGGRAAWRRKEGTP